VHQPRLDMIRIPIVPQNIDAAVSVEITGSHDTPGQPNRDWLAALVNRLHPPGDPHAVHQPPLDMIPIPIAPQNVSSHPYHPSVPPASGEGRGGVRSLLASRKSVSPAVARCERNNQTWTTPDGPPHTPVAGLAPHGPRRRIAGRYYSHDFTLSS